MDTEITERFDAIEARVVTLQTRVEQIHGQVVERDDRARDERQRHHADQMKAFQAVIDEVRVERDRRITALEAAVEDLRRQLATGVR